MNAAIPFLLLPVLTDALSPAAYGVLAMFQVLVQLLLPLAALNTENALTRFFYDPDPSGEGFRIQIGNVLLLLAISGAGLAGLLALAGSLLEDWIAFPATGLWAVWMYVIFRKLMETVLNLFRVHDRPVSFGLMRIGSTLLDVAASLYLVLELGRDWEGRMEGQVLGVVVPGAVALGIILWRFRARLKPDAGVREALLNYGVPLIPHVLGAALIVYSDRLILARMIDLEAAGLYAVGYQMGLVIFLLQNSFNQAWTPWLFAQLKQPDDALRRRLVKMTYAYAGLLTLAAAAFVLISPWIYRWFIGDAFHDSRPLVFWIALAFVFNGVYKMFANYLFYLKSTRIIGIITFSTALLNIALNVWWIDWLGMIGAAYATCVSFAVQMVWVAAVSSRRYPMPWIWNKQRSA